MADTFRHLTEEPFDDGVLLRLMDQSAEDEGAMLMQRYQNETAAEEPELDALCRRRMEERFRKDSLLRLQKHVLRGAVCLVTAVLALGGLALCFSSEARAAMLRWITRQEDNAVTYSPVVQETEEEEFLCYEITRLPAEYTIMEEQSNAIPGVLFYDNPEGNHMLFFFQPPDGRGTLYIIPGEDTKTSVLVNGVSADLYVAAEEGKSSNIIWTDPETGYLLMIQGVFSEEALIELAESVVLVEE